MTIALAVIVAVLVVVHNLERIALQRRCALAEAEWREERRELLNRIQHPERVIATTSEPVAIPDREPDGWAEVGRVRVTKDWLEAKD